MIFNVSVLTVGIFAFCMSVATSETIKCFQCNSIKDTGCADLTPEDTNSTYYQDCEETLRQSGGKTPFCRKTKLTILNEEKNVRVIRECGWETYKTNMTRCYEVDTDFKFEVSCQCFKDGCNAAPQRFSRSYFLVFLALAAGLGIRVVN